MKPFPVIFLLLRFNNRRIFVWGKTHCFPQLVPPKEKLLCLAGGQFIPAGFDCGHSSASNFASLKFFNSFFHAVLNPPKYKQSRNVPWRPDSKHSSSRLPPLLPSEQQRGKTVEALPPHGPRVPTRHFEIGVFNADFVETFQHGLAIPIGNVLLPAH